MAQRVQPILLIEEIGSNNPGHSTRRTQELIAIGWESRSPVLQPALPDGTPGRLLISVHPDESAFNTASEQH